MQPDIAHTCCYWQLSKQGILWPVSHDHIEGSGINHPGYFFFKFSVDKFLVLNWLLAVDFFAVFTSLLFEVIMNLLIGALPLALVKYVKISILGKLVDKLLTFDKGQILHGF